MIDKLSDDCAYMVLAKSFNSEQTALTWSDLRCCLCKVSIFFFVPRLLLILALQSLVDLSLFQNFPPLLSLSLSLSYVSSSSRTYSLNLPQPTQVTSNQVFLNVQCLLIEEK